VDKKNKRDKEVKKVKKDKEMKASKTPKKVKRVKAGKKAEVKKEAKVGEKITAEKAKVIEETAKELLAKLEIKADLDIGQEEEIIQVNLKTEKTNQYKVKPEGKEKPIKIVIKGKR